MAKKSKTEIIQDATKSALNYMLHEPLDKPTLDKTLKADIIHMVQVQLHNSKANSEKREQDQRKIVKGGVGGVDRVSPPQAIADKELISQVSELVDNKLKLDDQPFPAQVAEIACNKNAETIEEIIDQPLASPALEVSITKTKKDYETIFSDVVSMMKNDTFNDSKPSKNLLHAPTFLKGIRYAICLNNKEYRIEIMTHKPDREDFISGLYLSASSKTPEIKMENIPKNNLSKLKMVIQSSGEISQDVEKIARIADSFLDTIQPFVVAELGRINNS